jgi:hypothetical protein
MTIQGFRITNKGRAALIAMKENAKQDEEVPAHYRIADALAEAGLLAPDLPEPSAGSDGALLWHNETVWIEDDEVAVYTDLPKSIGWMTTNEARNLAHALLAAAEYAKEQE